MSKLYNSGLGSIADGTISWATSTIKVMVVSSSYAFNDNHVFVSSITNEVTNDVGTGYERKTLTGKTVTVDQANDRVVFDADDVAYTAVETNEVWAGAIVYLDSGVDATSRLIAYLTITPLTTNGSDATIVWASTGIFRFNNT